MSKKLFCILILISIMASCGGGGEFHKNPMDEIIRDLTAPKFTIILHDMDVEGSFFKTYKHQYKIITEEDSVPKEEITGWYEVDEKLFQQHEQDMGMELAHKGEDGKLQKQVAPPGYSQYVGNDRYGRWETRSDGSSFWAFYGKYAFMSSMFNMFAYPARRSYYDGYRSSYGSGRPYYGPTTNGRRAYGTYSDHVSKTRPNSRYTSSRSFKSRVRSGTSRSSRSSRSGSRYNSRSSSRSRGGGFGK